MSLNSLKFESIWVGSWVLMLNASQLMFLTKKNFAMIYLEKILLQLLWIKSFFTERLIEFCKWLFVHSNVDVHIQNPRTNPNGLKFQAV